MAKLKYLALMALLAPQLKSLMATPPVQHQWARMALKYLHFALEEHLQFGPLVMLLPLAQFLAPAEWEPLLQLLLAPPEWEHLPSESLLE
ncbi:hypothetical protein Taro_029978 [Colocasia esculenta]|uniref:Uncharacterized protein n=1 Tax=Colocasia esculenta TaxID=4460 RepID=A0A843VQL2_COLES|nr:hypothetical protein [Colocasia esculenta]